MVPSYDKLYMPMLQTLSDKTVYSKKELVQLVAKRIALSEEDFAERMSNGILTFPNRVAWACTYLKKAGLIENPSRSRYVITDDGLAALFSGEEIDNKYLYKYPSFVDFKEKSNKDYASSSGSAVIPNQSEIETPADMIERAISATNQKLADELMSEIMNPDPTFFEHLVVKLLCKMGYGGSSSDSGVVTQKNNDGGIDGIIREDKLGFDQIYIQAKRWDMQTTISRPEIQKFYGALAGFSASKGLFITTAKFSDGAKEYANQQHIVLVDGDRLTKLMIEYNLGVSPIAKYEIKALDTDFFHEDQDL